MPSSALLAAYLHEVVAKRDKKSGDVNATAAAIAHAVRKAGVEMVPGIGAQTVARSDRSRLVAHAGRGDVVFRVVQAGVASLFLSCEVGVDVATKKQKTREPSSCRLPR
jgi:hypothetical protein